MQRDQTFLQQWTAISQDVSKLRIFIQYKDFRQKYATLVREFIAPTPEEFAKVYLKRKTFNLGQDDLDPNMQEREEKKLLNQVWIATKLEKAIEYLTRGYDISKEKGYEFAKDEPEILVEEIGLTEKNTIGRFNAAHWKKDLKKKPKKASEHSDFHNGEVYDDLELDFDMKTLKVKREADPDTTLLISKYLVENPWFQKALSTVQASPDSERAKQ